MATYRIDATGFAIALFKYQSLHDDYSSYTSSAGDLLVLQFGNLPSISASEYVTSASLHIRTYTKTGDKAYGFVRPKTSSQPINVDTVSYKTLPTLLYDNSSEYAYENQWVTVNLNVGPGLENVRMGLANCFVIKSDDLKLYTPASSYAPYIEIVTTTTRPTPQAFEPSCLDEATGGGIAQDKNCRFRASGYLTSYPINPINTETRLEWKTSDGVVNVNTRIDNLTYFYFTPMELQQGSLSVRTVYETEYGTARSAWVSYVVNPAGIFLKSNSLYLLPASEDTVTVKFINLESEYAMLVSAVLRWRKVGDSSFNEMSMTGAKATFPPGSFKAGVTYEFQCVSAWNTGVTSTSRWSSLDTFELKIYRPTPSQGFVDDTSAITFSWFISCYSQRWSGYDDIPTVQTSAVFKWKPTASGTIRSISVGSNQFVTVPANTFPGDSFYWTVETVSADGTALTTDWYFLTTVESVTSTAVASYPFAVIVDGSKEAEFRWAHVITTGTQPTKSEIQVKTDSSAWSTVKTIVGSNTVAYFPAGTLPAGRVYWRVRTYNTENAVGAWSEPAEITVIAAPSTPVIRIISATPHFVVGWATDQQKSFEIMLNGELIAAEYSEMREYQHSGYIPAGTYTIDVRSQNEYGMWSQWGKAMINIANTPGESISLVVSNSAFAVSLWFETAGDFEKYQIIKDGAVIGETTERSFVDQFATVDPSSYKVLGILANGNYSESPAITAAASVSTISIFGLDDREWIPLRLSAQQMRATAVTYRRQTALTHYTGTPLPSIEYGEQQDFTYQFACAFRPDDPLVQKFDRLFTQPVILKDPNGTVIAGALSTINKSMVETHIAYTCSVSAAAIQEVDVNG